MTSQWATGQMKPVQLGKGSIADSPPTHKETKKLFAVKPRLEDGVKNKPMPTNDWWTTLLHDTPFPGKMWAYPLTVSADSSGVKVWYPKGWSDNGTELKLGEPLVVQGVSQAKKGASKSRILFDFEHTKWPSGWKATGTSFEAGAMTPAEHKVDGFVGKSYACSFRQGDRGTGTAVSPAFKVDKDYIHFQICGGNDKSKLGVYLTIKGERVLQSVGKNSNKMKWVTWNVSKFKGKKATIEIVDDSKGGWGFIGADQITLSSEAKPSSGGVFQYTSTKSWGDWSVVMRLNAAEDAFADVTFGRGLPYTWIECNNIGLQIPLSEDKILDLKGKKVKMPYTGSNLIIERDDRLFGLFAPKGTKFIKKKDMLQITFDSESKYLVVGAVPTLKDAKTFARHAYAVPRDTRFDWEYDAKAGEVSTKWKASTESLRGKNTKLLQGWIPHHWRVTKNDLTFLKPEFMSQRGRMRLTSGTEFHISWPFRGMLPVFPEPNDTEDKNPFDKKRLTGYLNSWTQDILNKPKSKRYGKDTYWGGKHLLTIAKSLTIATQLDVPIKNDLEMLLKECLSNWFTYTSGEDAFYFAQYPLPWSGLVGFNPSYGSGAFSDNHFHYGHYVLAASFLAMNDPQWFNDYKEVITLIAQQYANWERDHKTLPFLRTFDPWSGHSYAGGMSSPGDGNNQESSSESMMSWSGLFMLGSVANDPKIQACGAMGYAIESEAIQEYWNDYYGWKEGPKAANHPPAYKKKTSIASVMRDRDIGYWTWFSGEPIHIYGIQWLPSWCNSYYMGRYPDHVLYQIDQMRIKQGKGGPKVSYASLGHDWGQVTLGYQTWADPASVCRILDEEHAASRELGGYRNGGENYFLAHAYRSLGKIAWDSHTSSPTSLVFVDAQKNHTAVIWNPTDKEQKVDIYIRGKVEKTITAPARTLEKYKL